MSRHLLTDLELPELEHPAELVSVPLPPNASADKSNDESNDEPDWPAELRVFVRPIDLGFFPGI